MKNSLKLVLASAVSFATISCQQNNKTTENQSANSSAISFLDSTTFETTLDGKAISLFKLENSKGMKASITNYGGRILSLLVPQKDGKIIDVVVGMKDLKSIKNSTDAYYGAIIGRYGNRIAKGQFTIDGKTYTSSINNGVNTLHGGKLGYHYVTWNPKLINKNTLELTYLSKDLEEGYPGNLTIKVTYSLTDDNELKIEYSAQTDKKTVLNLTNHAYFNLNGEGNGTILNHDLEIYANQFTPVDTDLIPTGKLQPVVNTPFDFNKATKIGARINDQNEQLKNGKGYDHNYVLNGKVGLGITHAASVKGDLTGIVMDVFTQEPGIQFYSGNFMNGANTFKNGAKDDFRTAFCLETQHYPNSPNQSNFPSTLLNPEQQYHTISIYKFSNR
jgi:aldose 1-epimerase